MKGKTLKVLLSAAVFTSMVFGGIAMAGQFKTLDGVANLAVGGNVQAYSSPKNTSLAMELETYEWLTGPTDRYRCSIFSNFTGQDLILRFNGLTGLPFSSCTTPINGTCATACVNIVGGAKFNCTVNSGFGSPIAGNTSFYGIRVERCTATQLAPAGANALETLSVEQQKAAGMAVGDVQ